MILISNLNVQDVRGLLMTGHNLVLVGNSLRQVGLTPLFFFFKHAKVVADLKIGILKSRLQD